MNFPISKFVWERSTVHGPRELTQTALTMAAKH